MNVGERIRAIRLMEKIDQVKVIKPSFVLVAKLIKNKSKEKE